LKASLTDDMARALICREMKWTWHEYDEQPAGFIDTIVEMLKAESREMDRKRKNI
jgi:hypothetical protein